MNRQQKRTLASVMMVALGVLWYAADAAGCTIDVSSAPTPAQLVDRAALIVHVKAAGYCTGSTQDCGQLPNSVVAEIDAEGAHPPVSFSSVGAAADGLIDFEVLRVLKGPTLPAIIRIPGKLTGRDDFNDRPVPYTFVRRGGRSGNCFAYEYRTNAEYVLFLRPGSDVMTPYWAPLAPINEQVRSDSDPWIDWINRRIMGKELPLGRPTVNRPLQPASAPRTGGRGAR